MQRHRPSHQPDAREVDEVVRRAIAEDLGESGDITTKRLLRIEQPGRATLIAKGRGVLAGTPVAAATFTMIDRTLQVRWLLSDGALLEPGTVVAELSGRARAILAAERVALNFLQHLSGVATATAALVAVCEPYGVEVMNTRKTLPGLRALQRYAVAVGGGTLHRAGLYDAILIKNNHEVFTDGAAEAVRRIKANPNLRVAVEVRDLTELEQVIEAGADWVLLDNAELEIVEKAVNACRDRVFLEITGGVTIDNAEQIARLRPDAISTGSITHSVRAVDLALHVIGA